ncbi:MAG: peptidase S41 [Candidatus Omnitrophica bacterium CG08_land_8_20_14_0_20_41_16]|uniref:Peptidase S41 n=1 Tax=Candidatus Sherwoodlollariibacterium unditelluris TaxID=1974757 RepID=A0A2G9YKM2_9BACT|nr:MAG: peptidase S41 [Candidatus Omnitrophica bacterium CG23_combo_of_CG06-09_8_20_14_all_41_10]PIS34068.1 MAG: peptidase S41 [Candidatus Omnitrophica bacterium CG08_land_8_20_14_0_20_41_16]
MRRRFIIALVFLVIGLFVFASIVSSGADKKKKDDLYRQVGIFSDTLAIIQSDYVDETKPKDLIYGALKGMLASLDPHSQFMDPDTYNELRVETEGKFGGLGIEVTIKDGLLTIITPIEDTPAWRAGLKPLDRIVKINNDITRDMTLSEAVKRMRGKPGEVVNLTILREAENKILEFKIVRAIIKIKDIKEARILEDGIGYIRLVEFREDTLKDINLVLNNLSKQGLNALILDLRNNPGGLLEAAAQVAGKFIPKGKLVVYTKGRKVEQALEFVSESSRPILNLPMVILINEGSASGSEIVAGALKDYKRAIIMGTKSFGKGSVQTVIPLSDGSALKLTTSKYFTPAGKEIHDKGVIPDIVVEEVRIEISKSDVIKSKRAQEVFEEVKNKSSESEEVKEFDYKADNQIMRAVDVLKALKFYGAHPG